MASRGYFSAIEAQAKHFKRLVIEMSLVQAPLVGQAFKVGPLLGSCRGRPLDDRERVAVRLLGARDEE